MFLKIGPEYASDYEKNLKLTLESEEPIIPSNLDKLDLIKWNELYHTVKAPNGDLEGEMGNWNLTCGLEPEGGSPGNSDQLRISLSSATTPLNLPQSDR